MYRRLGGPQGPSGQVRKVSPLTGIRSPDRQARSKSLYRLRYPAHTIIKLNLKYFVMHAVWALPILISLVNRKRKAIFHSRHVFILRSTENKTDLSRIVHPCSHAISRPCINCSRVRHILVTEYTKLQNATLRRLRWRFVLNSMGTFP